MKVILFIQFYVEHYNAYNLCNGFSSAYNYCKSIGDFVWLSDKEMNNFQMPFNKGTVYISIFFTKQLEQVYNWASEYPDIKFIGGGPAITSGYDSTIVLPNNLKLVIQSVEEYFNIPNTSEKWDLDISSIQLKLNKARALTFSYPINSSCYWKKCIFCKQHVGNLRRNKNVDLTNAYNIKYNGMINIRLDSPSITTSDIKSIIPKLKYKDNYAIDFLMRCDKAIYTTLDNVLKNFKGEIPNLKIRLGIEFPSNRLLSYMKKGFSVDDILNTIKILNKYKNIKIYGLFIVSWPTINEQDIDELKHFINETSNLKIDVISFSKLFCMTNTKAYEMYKNTIERQLYATNLYKGYYPQLTNKEKEYDNKAIELINNSFKKSIIIDRYNKIGIDKDE